MSKKKTLEEILAKIEGVKIVDHLYIDNEGKIATIVEDINEKVGHVKITAKEIEILAEKERRRQIEESECK